MEATSSNIFLSPIDLRTIHPFSDKPISKMANYMFQNCNQGTFTLYSNYNLNKLIKNVRNITLSTAEFLLNPDLAKKKKKK